MLRSALALAALALATAPAAASAATSPALSLSGHKFNCYQSFANYGPHGTLSGYNRAGRGSVEFATDYVPSYLRAGEQGSFDRTATGLRFTSGRFYRPSEGWQLVGTVHPAGITMPHDLKPGTRYQLILRSDPGAKKISDAAPPKRIPPNFFLTPWYCQQIS
jgi:hypothetical protein